MLRCPLAWIVVLEEARVVSLGERLLFERLGAIDCHFHPLVVLGVLSSLRHHFVAIKGGSGSEPRSGT